MERRTVLKTVGGIGSTAAIGGLGLFALSGSAAATASGSFDYGSASVTSDDGSVEYVAIYGDSVIEWDGFDTPAQFFDIDIDARVVDKTEWVDLHETGHVDLDNGDWGNDESLSGSGTSGTIKSAIGLDGNEHDETVDWHIVGSDPDGYGLPENSIDPSELAVDSDGSSETFTVQKRITYTWYDDDKNDLFTEQWKADVDVTVTNEKSTANVDDGPGEDGVTAA